MGTSPGASPSIRRGWGMLAAQITRPLTATLEPRAASPHT